MVVGGAFFLRRHGNSRYQRIRTISVIFFQVVFAFALPLVMKVLGRQEYYFSYFWPLKIEYLYADYILQQPFLIVLYSFFGSLIVFPIAGYYLGKRFYCSWICGCGGLANTAGEPFRHLSSKSAAAWRFEKYSVYAVLVLAIAATIVVGPQLGAGAPPSGRSPLSRSASRRSTGSGWERSSPGVLGVGLYPLMGTRVWCRFACPMAALLGLIQKFGRFRITVKKDMCISCGNCSTYCEMGIDVRAVRDGQPVLHARGLRRLRHVRPHVPARRAEARDPARPREGRSADPGLRGRSLGRRHRFAPRPSYGSENVPDS